MKRGLLILLFFCCATPAFSQIHGNQLRDTDFTFWAKLSQPVKYYLQVDTVRLNDSWLVYHLDSTTAYWLQVLKDSADAISARIPDNVGGGGSSTGGELTTLEALNVGDGYVAMTDTSGNELTIQDSCVALVRCYISAQSQSGVSTAAYRFYAHVQRQGSSLTVKDSVTEYMYEDNPNWDIRFSSGSFSTLRIQAKADVNDTARFTAVVEVTRTCRAPVDTTNHMLQPFMVADLNLWLDADTVDNPYRPVFHSGTSLVSTWYDRSDSAHNATQSDSALSYEWYYDVSRGRFGMIQHRLDSMSIGGMHIATVFIMYRMDYQPGTGFSAVRLLSPWRSVASGLGIYLASQAGGFYTQQPGLFPSGQERYNDTLTIDGGRGEYFDPMILYHGTGGASTYQQWHLTNQTGGPPLGWQAIIYEVIAYSRSLTNYERRGIYNYLKNKYNL